MAGIAKRFSKASKTQLKNLLDWAIRHDFLFTLLSDSGLLAENVNLIYYLVDVLIWYSLQLSPADKEFPSLLRATPPIK